MFPAYLWTDFILPLHHSLKVFGVCHRVCNVSFKWRVLWKLWGEWSKTLEIWIWLKTFKMKFEKYPKVCYKLFLYKSFPNFFPPANLNFIYQISKIQDKWHHFHLIPNPFIGKKFINFFLCSILFSLRSYQIVHKCDL